MKRLLKGIIDFGGTSQASMASNFQRVRASQIQWINPSDAKIYRFVHDFFEKELELPNIRTLGDFFKKSEDIETIERLKDIKGAPLYEGANFSFVLKGLLEDQNRLRLLTVIKEAQEVAQKGLIIEEGRSKKRIQGVKSAVIHFQRQAAELLIPDHNARTRGDLRDASPETLEDYKKAKSDPGHAWGAFMGVDNVDKVCKGLKRGELWIHAAFTGELKTALALNWCYNLVTLFRRNVFFVSLEMPFRQVRNIICALHSANPIFKAQGYRPLDYRKIRDGELNEEEEAFMKVVLDDFENNPEYCRFELWCPDQDKTTIGDIRLEAELLHRQMEIGMLCIDHGGLVDPIVHYREFNIALNSVIRDSKKLALHFNQGEGLPVLLLFQMNRQGKDAADKNEGVYKLSALSHANEAERSADVVTSTYLNDELREAGQSIMCCLKNRDNPQFKPFKLAVEFPCRRIYQPDGSESEIVHDGDDEAFNAQLNEAFGSSV